MLKHFVHLIQLTLKQLCGYSIYHYVRKCALIDGLIMLIGKISFKFEINTTEVMTEKFTFLAERFKYRDLLDVKCFSYIYI